MVSSRATAEPGTEVGQWACGSFAARPKRLLYVRERGALLLVWLNRFVDLGDRPVDRRRRGAAGVQAGALVSGSDFVASGGGWVLGRCVAAEFGALFVGQRLLEILQRLMDDVDRHGQHLNLQIHQLQSRSGLYRDTGRAGFSKIIGCGGDRPA